MHKRHITKSERTNIIALDALLAHLDKHIMPHVDKMGKGFAKRIRTAFTNIKTAVTDYCFEIDEQDLKKIVKESSSTQIVLTSAAYKIKTAQEKDMDILYTLAEHAIANNCQGCTKDGNTCPLKHALSAADIPYATTEPVNCPYELPAKNLQ